MDAGISGHDLGDIEAKHECRWRRGSVAAGYFDGFLLATESFAEGEDSPHMTALSWSNGRR